MIKLSDFIAKPVLSIYEGVNEGVIKTAFFDKKYNKLKYFVMFDDMDNEMEEKVLSIDKIYSAGQDAIMVRNDSSINLLSEVKDKFGKENPINFSVYNLNGSFIGKISDIKMNDKFNMESFILSDNTEISIQSFLSSSCATMIVKNNESNAMLHHFKPKNNILKLDIQENKDVFILKSENEYINQKLQQNSQNNEIMPINAKQTIINLEAKKTDTQLPNVITSNVNFLIGRKATKNIYSPNNEIIVKRNTIINSSNIEIAKKYGKIKELATFSI